MPALIQGNAPSASKRRSFHSGTNAHCQTAVLELGRLAILNPSPAMVMPGTALERTGVSK